MSISSAWKVAELGKGIIIKKKKLEKNWSKLDGKNELETNLTLYSKQKTPYNSKYL